MGGASSPDFERFLAAMPGGSPPSWVHFRGRLPLPETADFYAALDLFALPSRTDSFGIVILEAWANGLPVVAAAAGGLIEVVRDGETGILVPFGDVDRLASALGRLLDRLEEGRALGEAGRAQVASGYTWDDRYETLLGRTTALVRAGRSRLGRAG
jgi:glycosyltransferase involved in cell wall biosynthesis